LSRCNRAAKRGSEMLSCGVSSAVEIISGVVNFTFLRAQHSFRTKRKT